MTEENYTYDVKCRTCRSIFQVQLFDSHQRNLFSVDNKYWHCEKCKREYFNKQAAKLTEEHQAIGFPELEGSEKMISWAVKIRAELINKVDYLRKSLTFANNDEKQQSEMAFDLFFKEWHTKRDAKWWIDNRKMTVRDISNRVKEISEPT